MQANSENFFPMNYSYLSCFGFFIAIGISCRDLFYSYNSILECSKIEIPAFNLPPQFVIHVLIFIAFLKKLRKAIAQSAPMFAMIRRIGQPAVFGSNVKQDDFFFQIFSSRPKIKEAYKTWKKWNQSIIHSVICKRISKKRPSEVIGIENKNRMIRRLMR